MNIQVLNTTQQHVTGLKKIEVKTCHTKSHGETYLI